ncbi:hypothetical protein MUK42_22640 [Musa troglodytarum]|uniref:Uncharacterized protein n=1 Tax=Musa troglodytarum TaxID=320322 RepID=A0A9E7FY77_9LILI|nr:hypothetical protein MUK42_22640 [Musa troglodytarum]
MSVLRLHLVHSGSQSKANGWSVKPEPCLGTTPQHMATATPPSYPFQTALQLHIQPLIVTNSLGHGRAQAIQASPPNAASPQLPNTFQAKNGLPSSEGAEGREAGGEGLPRRGAKEPEEKLSQPGGSRAGRDVRAQHSRALPLQINDIITESAESDNRAA